MAVQNSLNSNLGNQTQYGVLVGQGANAAVIATSQGTNGQVLLGGTTNPAFATLTSSDSTVTFTTGNNSLSIQAVGGGMVWSVVTGASQAMVKSNGYFSNNAGAAVAFTLPASAAVGDTFAISNMGARAAGWSLAYGTSQYIRFGNSVTTTTTGSLAATQTGDSITLVCSVANTEFVVRNSVGNITIV